MKIVDFHKVLDSAFIVYNFQIRFTFYSNKTINTHVLNWSDLTTQGEAINLDSGKKIILIYFRKKINNKIDFNVQLTKLIS